MFTRMDADGKEGCDLRAFTSTKFFSSIFRVGHTGRGRATRCVMGAWNSPILQRDGSSNAGVCRHLGLLEKLF